MPRSKGRKGAIRFSVSLDPHSYSELSRIAGTNDVSLAWTVRKAIAEFVERQEDTDEGKLPILRPPRE